MNRNFAQNIGTGGANEVQTDPLLSDREVAAQLDCGRSTVWRWSAEGVLPQPIKIGGLSRWRQSWIVKVVADAEANRVAA